MKDVLHSMTMVRKRKLLSEGCDGKMPCFLFQPARNLCWDVFTLHGLPAGSSTDMDQIWL
jgi:hypothetical protein